jgi:mannose-6-phosphate isomerase-like protein (cupin superfamily)
VLRPGDKFVNPRTGASIEVLRASGAGARGFEVRRVVKPGTGKTVPHVHADYVESFIVERGHAVARSGGRTHELGPGDELAVPAGGRHVNAWNPGDEDLLMRHVFEPASAFALGYVETLCHLMLAGRTDRQGEVPLSAAFAVAGATRGETFAAGVPRILQTSVLIPLGTWLRRLRGYELHLPG